MQCCTRVSRPRPFQTRSSRLTLPLLVVRTDRLTAAVPRVVYPTTRPAPHHTEGPKSCLKRLPSGQDSPRKFVLFGAPAVANLLSTEPSSALKPMRAEAASSAFPMPPMPPMPLDRSHDARKKPRLRASKVADRTMRMLLLAGMDPQAAEGVTQNRLRIWVKKVLENMEAQAAETRRAVQFNQRFVRKVRIVCRGCGNSDPRTFIQDSTQGDLICIGADGLGCGMVLEERCVEEGEFFRRFEGEEDRNHHGPVSNPLFSQAWNSTTRCGTGALGSLMRRVDAASSSAARRTKHETREWYKDEHKKQSFALIDEIAVRESVTPQAVSHAKLTFAAWRDQKQRDTELPVVITACVLAGEELHDADARVE